MPDVGLVGTIQAIVSGSVDVQGHRAMAIAPCVRLVMLATVSFVVMLSTQNNLWLVGGFMAVWIGCAANLVFINNRFATSKDHPFEKYDLLREAVQKGMSAADVAKLAKAIEIGVIQQPQPQPGPQVAVPLATPASLRVRPDTIEQRPVVPPQPLDSPGE